MSGQQGRSCIVKLDVNSEYSSLNEQTTTGSLLFPPGDSRTFRIRTAGGEAALQPENGQVPQRHAGMNEDSTQSPSMSSVK